MRKIKGSSDYLKNQVRKNLAMVVICAIIFVVISTFLIYRIISTLQVGILDEVGFVFLLMPLAAFYFYLRKYHIYNGGWKGEKEVTSLLSHTLSDNYYLLNDLYLHGGGDIDHIVFGPNGVFVLETKNWSGKIVCNGDEWQRAGKRSFSGSPSRQLKRNIAKIQYLIDNSSVLRHLGIRVEGVVVFTNKHALIQVNNPTVTILRLSQLPAYITTYKRSPNFSGKQIEAIGREIVNQKR